MTGRMAVALIGAGRIGTLHANVLAADDAVGELILVDEDAAHARELATGLDASVAQTMDAAIERA
ncbi:MAG TPA: hypothetical protein VH720_15230, partial [Candidatus Limnocylindrales bacterium]